MNPTTPERPWLPIGEAPKDGTIVEAVHIDRVSGTSDVFRARWSTFSNCWKYGDGNMDVGPTHFRPLPSTETGERECVFGDSWDTVPPTAADRKRCGCGRCLSASLPPTPPDAREAAKAALHKIRSCCGSVHDERNLVDRLAIEALAVIDSLPDAEQLRRERDEAIRAYNEKANVFNSNTIERDRLVVENKRIAAERDALRKEVEAMAKVEWEAKLANMTLALNLAETKKQRDEARTAHDAEVKRADELAEQLGVARVALAEATSGHLIAELHRQIDSHKATINSLSAALTAAQQAAREDGGAVDWLEKNAALLVSHINGKYEHEWHLEHDGKMSIGPNLRAAIRAAKEPAAKVSS